MGYTFSNTEKTKKKASEYETYAALYMLGVYPQKEKMEYILVDSFNDVSSATANINEIYDVQSKGYKSVSQEQIGRFLYTLFKNYQTDFPFKEFIIFLETIDTKFLINASKVFSFSNFNDNDKERVKKGLHKEIAKRDKISFDENLEKQIDSFLSNVVFVINQFTKQDAVKKLIPIKNTTTFPDTFYISIFDEIRDKQSSLKNIFIENFEIEYPSEVLKFNKHISRRELNGLLINRVIGCELFKNNLPFGFLPYLQTIHPNEDLEDIIQKCNSELALMFFDKNNKRNIWKLCFHIIDLIYSNPKNKSEEILHLLKPDLLIKAKISEESAIYLISRIQEGQKNANS